MDFRLADCLPLGIVTLIAARQELRRNLYDTSTAPAIDPPALQGSSPRYLTARTPDGSYNDLAQPAMGSTGTRFGRNVPLEHTYPRVARADLAPNPRLVSRELLTRDTFTARQRR